MDNIKKPDITPPIQYEMGNDSSELTRQDVLKEYIYHHYINIKSLTLLLQPNGKVSNVKGWSNPNTNTINLDTAHNLAILTGKINNIIVVDVDVKDKGVEVWEHMIDEFKQDISEWQVQLTPSGGIHIVFEYDSSIKGSNRCIKNYGTKIGIDIKTDGGYIAVEPSFSPIYKKSYKWKNMINVKKLIKMPDWLRNIIVRGYYNEQDVDIFDEIITSRKVSEATTYDNLKRKNTSNTNPKQFIELLDILPISYWTDFESWKNLVWIVARLFVNEDDGFTIAHNYSKNAENYNERLVGKLFEQAIDSKEGGYGYSKLLEYCREVDNNKVNTILSKYSPQVTKLLQFTKDKYSILDFDTEFNGKTFESLDELFENIIPKLRTVCIYKSNSEYVYKTSKGSIISNDKYQIMIFYYKQDKKLLHITLYNILNLYIYKLDRFNHICYKVNNYDINCFNLFTGLYAERTDNSIDISELLSFIKLVICDDNEDYYNYIMNWLKVVCHGGRTQTALFLYSPDQGVGKNTFIDFFIEYVIGKHNSIIAAGMREVLDTHSNLSGKIIVNVNELSSTKEHYKSDFDKLKSYITQDSIIVNEKNVKKFEIENMTNWIFTSNNQDSIILDKDDRRIVCLEVSSLYKQNIVYFKKFRELFFNKLAGDTFYTYLLDNNFSNVDVRSCIKTVLKDSIIDSNMGGLDCFVRDIKNKSLALMTENGKISSKELFKEYIQYCNDNNFTFKVSNTKFGRDINKYFVKERSNGTKYNIY